MRLFPEPSTILCNMTGRIHSLESFGTVDGPGLRYVVFMQGCPMRCQYCHNPDTWNMSGGTEITVAEILSQYEKNRPFYRNGGLTVTGGEPLMQIDFVTELLTQAQQKGIHTCIDTSGITYSPDNRKSLDKLDKLLSATDLVMLDIKHIRSDRHKTLTGHENSKILDFARYLDKKHIPVWIRHVVVPGHTDDADDLKELGHFIGELKNVKALDVLPYHVMGQSKYEQLGLEYPLENVPACSKEKASASRDIILEGIREKRKLLGKV